MSFSASLSFSPALTLSAAARHLLGWQELPAGQASTQPTDVYAWEMQWLEANQNWQRFSVFMFALDAMG